MIGYVPTGYWPDDYWPDEFWPETAESAALSFHAAIIQSADDAREVGAGTVSITNAYLSFAGAAQHVGLRFQSVTIPQGSTINSATITVYVNNATYDDPDVDIYGEDADDAAAFTTTNNDISGRTKTTATVAWTATAIGTGQKQSPDIKTIIQEITDRPGWSSGNDLVIILTGQPSYAFEIAAYDSTDPEAEIDIDYTPPSLDVNVSLSPLLLATSALSLAVAPGAVSTAVDLLAAVATALTAAVLPGGVSAQLDLLTADADALDVTVAPGDRALALALLAGVLSTQPLTVAPGDVAITLDLLAGVLAALESIISVEGVDVTIDLAVLIGALAAEPLAVMPGAVTTPLALLTAALAWLPVDIIGIAFDQLVNLALLTSAAELPTLAIEPGPISVSLNLIEGYLSFHDLLVFLMLGCAVATDRERYGALAADWLRFYATASDRTGCCE